MTRFTSPEMLEAEGHELIAKGHAKLAEARRLAARAIQPRPIDDDSTYTTRSLPPDISKAARFNTLAPCVPGARKQGRVWMVPRAAWEAYRARTPKLASAADYDPEIESLAAAALAAAGLRPTLRKAGGA